MPGYFLPTDLHPDLLRRLTTSEGPNAKLSRKKRNIFDCRESRPQGCEGTLELRPETIDICGRSRKRRVLK